MRKGFWATVTRRMTLFEQNYRAIYSFKMVFTVICKTIVLDVIYERLDGHDRLLQKKKKESQGNK